jgi:hypothetical protein
MPLFEPKRVSAQVVDDARDSSQEERRQGVPGDREEPLQGLFDQVMGTRVPDGVAVGSLTPGTMLELKTRNTKYLLTLVDGEGHALIKGGAFFPQPTPVHIEGATFGGNVKLGWIGIGLSLELSIGSRIITTSPVQSVEPIAA